MDSEVELDKIEIEARLGNPYAKLQVEEKKISKQVELIAHGYAKKLGYDTVPWYTITQLVLIIYVVLTILSMFFRPDFFNVSLQIMSLTRNALGDNMHYCSLHDYRYDINKKRNI